MWAVYPVGTGSLWNNDELKYSLRALERYSTDVTDVAVIGNPPDFLSMIVHTHKMNDEGKPPQAVLEKLLWAADCLPVGQKFVWMMDDIFLTKKMTLENYPYRHVGHLPSDLGAPPSKLVTGQVLERWHSSSDFDFSVHCPFIIETEKFLAMRSFWNQSKKDPHGYSIRSLYANIHGVPAIQTDDCKIREELTLEEVQNYIADLDCFSVSDTGLCGGAKQYLSELFPHKCRFEKE